MTEKEFREYVNDDKNHLNGSMRYFYISVEYKEFKIKRLQMDNDGNLRETFILNNKPYTAAECASIITDWERSQKINQIINKC